MYKIVKVYLFNKLNRCTIFRFNILSYIIDFQKSTEYNTDLHPKYYNFPNCLALDYKLFQVQVTGEEIYKVK